MPLWFCSAWNPAAFASLRDCTIAEAAAALASAGRLAALPLLLQRHPRALLPSVLEVLTAIPETLDPKQYAPLLRQVGSHSPLHRDQEPHWCPAAPAASPVLECAGACRGHLPAPISGGGGRLAVVVQPQA